MSPRRRQSWGPGDLFLTRQSDGRSTLGQVLDIIKAPWIGPAPRVAIFDIRVGRSVPQTLDLSLERMIIRAVVTPDSLDEGWWPVVGRRDVAIPLEKRPYEGLQERDWTAISFRGSSTIDEDLELRMVPDGRIARATERLGEMGELSWTPDGVPALNDLADADPSVTRIAFFGRAKNLRRLREFARLEGVWVYGANPKLVEYLADTLPNLQTLVLKALRAPHLRPLQKLSELRTLMIEYSPKLENLEDLYRIPSLEQLSLDELRKVTSLRPLGRLDGVRALSIFGGVPGLKMKIDTLKPLLRMKGLEAVAVRLVHIADRPSVGPTVQELWDRGVAVILQCDPFPFSLPFLRQDTN